MQLIPIKTKVFIPPQDDLYAVLNESLTELQEGDVVLITSKVVSIHQGRCVSIEEGDKTQLVVEEADALLTTTDRTRPFTIKYHALISNAGIDESNGNGYYILLPTDPYATAKEIHRYLLDKHGLTHLGVILTDSHSLPFRYGAMSVSISFWGFEPMERYGGKPDLFGRPFHFSRLNIVDSLSASSALVGGEGAESTPIVIARDVPNLSFTTEDTRHKLLVPPADDMYKSLFKDFHTKNVA